jgi:hypothetical protein
MYFKPASGHTKGRGGGGYPILSGHTSPKRASGAFDAGAQARNQWQGQQSPRAHTEAVTTAKNYAKKPASKAPGNGWSKDDIIKHWSEKIGEQQRFDEYKKKHKPIRVNIRLKRGQRIA